MEIRKGNDPVILLVGDIFFWTLALWLAIFARDVRPPSIDIFLANLYPFLTIFFFWAIVFFIFNLYGRFVQFFRKELAAVILRAQVTNSIVAIAFFYFFPGFGVTPKTILFLDLVFSFVLIFAWRFVFVPAAFRGKQERAILLGSGEEIDETKHELSKNPYFFELVELPADVSPSNIDRFEQFVEAQNVSVILANFRDHGIEKATPRLYNALFGQVRFVSIERIYEELFGRLPLSLISDGWILENISYRPKRGYVVLKRLMDIIISTALFILLLPLMVLTALAILFDDGMPFIFSQDRVGRNGGIFKLHKFRTMRAGVEQTPTQTNDPRITRIGTFLRRTRLDELPQLFNVITGSLSLVGSRPELPRYVDEYAREIPFYHIRHIIQPGISGWAQINYHEPAYSAATNAQKLSYEIYYIKNRSLILDLKIALKTIQTLLSRKGI